MGQEAKEAKCDIKLFILAWLIRRTMVPLIIAVEKLGLGHVFVEEKYT